MQYHVVGKRLFRNDIRSFSGTITVTSIVVFDDMHFGVDDEYKDSSIAMQGAFKGTYSFSEDRSLPHSGVFHGAVTSFWYVDPSNRLRYDDIESYMDGYSNNQFEGTWRAYSGKTEEICNWGDFRIPNSAHLDMGAGEFYPKAKYAQFGWQSYIDAYDQTSPEKVALERKQWWK